jgi:hypothetical protein
MNRRTSQHDPNLIVTVESRRPLLYSEGPSAELDRPAHVRAGSGLAWLPIDGVPRLVVAQDDTSFLAVVDPNTGRVDSIPLDHAVEGRRQFDAGRGNKAHKLDLEAACVVHHAGRDRVVVFGSGSSPARQRVVVVEPRGPSARLVDATPLYAALRACHSFSGSELNVEGATALGSSILLAQRGNGQPRGGLAAVDATCEWPLVAALEWLDAPGPQVPPISGVIQWDLGSIEGVRLTFTDLNARQDGIVGYLAAAEASPNAVDDGVVLGTAWGWFDGTEARWALIRNPDGTPLLDKAEGFVWSAGGSGRGFAVLDSDDPDRASELLELSIEGLPGRG